MLRAFGWMSEVAFAVKACMLSTRVEMPANGVS